MSYFTFRGDSESYISIPASLQTNMGEDDFTIEWYQYLTTQNEYPRVYQIGTLNEETVSAGVSIEGDSELQIFYYWNNIPASPIETDQFKNEWIHFAVVRNGGTTTIYKNGIAMIEPFSDTSNYTSDFALTIGNETTRTDIAAFSGYIKYFHIVKGYAKYAEDFVATSDYPEPIEGTTYLLRADEGSYAANDDLENITFSHVFGGEPEPEPPVVSRRSRFSLYSNNLVHYKRGSLSTNGSCGVRNSRIIKRRT